MKEREIVVFDFDGTLTHKDTLLDFIKFAKGKWRFYIGILILSPILIAYLLHLYPNDKAKQVVFRHFFKDMPYNKFKQLGEDFSTHINSIINVPILDKLEAYYEAGSTIYVISASIIEWVEPWCKAHHVSQVLGTLIEVSEDKRITGRFLSNNCYGQEKVKRLLSMEPHRESYHLVAYGDSNGDKELLAFADEGNLIIKDSFIKSLDLQEIIRFGIVGCIAVFIQFVAYYILVGYTTHNIALPLSYTISLAANYLLTTLFTFHVKPSKKNSLGFVGSHAINFTLQLLLLNLFVWIGIQKQWAIIPVFIICVPINFLLIRLSMKE